MKYLFKQQMQHKERNKNIEHTVLGTDRLKNVKKVSGDCEATGYMIGYTKGIRFEYYNFN